MIHQPEMHIFPFIWPNPGKGLFMKTPSAPLRNGETCRKISSQASICLFEKVALLPACKIQVLSDSSAFKLQF